MKSRDHEFEPWDAEGWSLSKREVMARSLVYRKGRRRKSSRVGISETRGGQGVKEVKSASGVAGSRQAERVGAAERATKVLGQVGQLANELCFCLHF